jgi:MoaA/NifB/PqqE/SkfB family radical SAM enzyme
MKSNLFSERRFCSWLITNFCNYHCTYCFGGGCSQITEKWDVDQIIKTLKTTEKKWCMGITGGEPFAYPNFIDICKKLIDNDITLYIDTNLSIESRVEDFIQTIQPQMVENLYIALHIEEREKRTGVDKFIKSVRKLQEKQFPFQINYVLHPKLLNRFQKDTDFFQSHGITLLPKPFQGIHNFKLYPEAYSLQVKKLILQSDPDAFRRTLFFSRGLACNAGNSLVRLLPNGNFTRCVADPTVVGSLKDGVTLLNKPIPCESLYCPCFGWDLIEDSDKKSILSKRLTDTEFNLFTIKRYVGFYLRVVKKFLKNLGI